jgi:hypothetical protein
VLQASISDALQRHSGQCPAGNDPQSMKPANTAGPAPDTREEPTPGDASDAALGSDAANARATDATASVAPASTSSASIAQMIVASDSTAPAPVLVQKTVAQQTQSDPSPMRGSIGTPMAGSQTASAATLQAAAVATRGPKDDASQQATAKKSATGGSGRIVWPATKLGGTVQSAVPEVIAMAATTGDTPPIAAPARSAHAIPGAEPVERIGASPVSGGSHDVPAVTTPAQDDPATPVEAAAQAPFAQADSNASPVARATPNAATQAGVVTARVPAPAALPLAMVLPAAAGAGNSGANSTPAATQTSDMRDGSGKSAAAAHDTQDSVQPTPHSHADASPAAAATPISASTQVAQAVVLPAHTAVHDATPAARTLDNASDAPGDAKLRDDSASLPQGVEDAAPASGIHAASVIQAMGGTEMRVGMHSAEFGDISIRTSVSAQQMLTQIAVDHSGLGQAISAHASSVQARFQEQYGVHAAIEVTKQGAAFAGEQGGSAQRERQGSVRSAGNETAPAPDETEIGLGQLAMAEAGDEYRLDIRA